LNKVLSVFLDLFEKNNIEYCILHNLEQLYTNDFKESDMNIHVIIIL